MIPVEVGIRAWIDVQKPEKRWTRAADVPWRSAAHGERVLVFDTETTTDYSQMLIFGFFRIYEKGSLSVEGIIVADRICDTDREVIREYAKRRGLSVFARERFVEDIFYPEVYVLGALCVGFNLPFDLSRIAIHAAPGRGSHRRQFRLVLTKKYWWPALRIESISGKASFIEFAPKRKLEAWETPFFKGRFLDLSTLTSAFTGERHSLRSAGRAFHAYTRKLKTPELGSVCTETLTYGRQDVRATWALYLALKNEYATHPFATFANERAQTPLALPITKIYSSATIAKQYLRLLGF